MFVFYSVPQVFIAVKLNCNPKLLSYLHVIKAKSRLDQYSFSLQGLFGLDFELYSH